MIYVIKSERKKKWNIWKMLRNMRDKKCSEKIIIKKNMKYLNIWLRKCSIQVGYLLEMMNVRGKWGKCKVHVQSWLNHTTIIYRIIVIQLRSRLLWLIREQLWTTGTMHRRQSFDPWILVSLMSLEGNFPSNPVEVLHGMSTSTA